MAKSFIFTKPQMTVVNKTTNETTVVGDENWAEDGITLNLSSDPREVSRFTGTDRFASGMVEVSGTAATILEGDDVWKLFDVFKVKGVQTVKLKNGTTGVKIGGGDTCSSSDEIEVVIEDKCRLDTEVQKRIKLTNIEFNTEDMEIAFNNSDGVTPEFAFYCNADDDGVKLLLGYDNPTGP